MVPSNIGVYEIIEEVGKGPSAIVYQATNKNTHKRVALKVINASLSSDESLITDLQRSVVVSSSLEHANIAKVYDLGEDLSYHFIASEFIDGVALQTLIEHYKKFDIDHACRIMQEAAKGLSFAHKQGIFHGCLHPGNIIIEKQTGRVVITDFGTSRALFTHNSELKNDSKRLGFIAPELSSDSAPDSQSDLFSLGAALYYMVTGERPAPGLVSTPGAALPQMPRLRAHLPKAPIWLETLVARLMVSDPIERDCSAEDFIEEIEVSDMAPLGENPFQSQERRSDSGSGFSGSQTSSGGDMRLLRSKTAGGTLGMLMRKQNVSSDMEASVQDAEKRLLNLEFNPREGDQGSPRDPRPSSVSRSSIRSASNAPANEEPMEPAAPQPAPQPAARRSQAPAAPPARPSRPTSVGARQSRRSQIPPQPQPQAQPAYNDSQYPPQQSAYPEQGGYPQDNYPPQPQPQVQPDYSDNQYPPQQDAYPEQSGYPQDNYPPQQDAYPEQGGYPQSNYPPQQNAYPEQGGYPQGNYSPQQNDYPEQGGYPQGNYSPQQNDYPEQGGYPQEDYPSEQGAYPEQPAPPVPNANDFGRKSGDFGNSLSNTSMGFDPNDPQPVPVPLSGSRFDAASQVLDDNEQPSQGGIRPMGFPDSRGQSQKAKHSGVGSQQLFVEDREQAGLGEPMQTSPFVSQQSEENDIASLRSGGAMGDAVINPNTPPSFPPGAPPKRPSFTDGPGTVRIAKQLQPQSSGSNIMGVIIALVVIVLLGGGGYYYFFFPKGQVKIAVNNAPKAKVSLIMQDNVIKTEDVVDGKLTLRIPLNKELVVRVSADGFKDHDTKLNLSSEAPVKDLQVDMVGAPTGLTVHITNEKLPSQPKVRVTCDGQLVKDGEMVAAGGLARFEVPTEKPLEVTVSAPGFLKHQEKVTVDPSEGDKDLQVTLKRNKGTVRVTPKGERFSQSSLTIVLMQNGKKITSKKISGGQSAEFEIDLGKTYTVKASSNLHSPAKKDVKVNASKPDAEVVLNMNLTPTLRIFTNANATVYLNGKYVGKADASGSLTLSSGLVTGQQYKITCKRGGYKDGASKLTMKPGDDNRVDLQLEKAPEPKKQPTYVYEEEAPASSSSGSYNPGGYGGSSYGSGDAYYSGGSSSSGSYSGGGGSSSGSSSSSSSSGGGNSWGGAEGGW